MKKYLYIIVIAIFPYLSFAQENDSIFYYRIELAYQNPLRVKELIIEGKFIDTNLFKIFKNLQRVVLTDCNAQAFINIAHYFKNLTTIIVDRNLDYIPDSFAQCKNLRLISFFNCAIKRIPSFFGSFENLEYLSFAFCYIQEIPITLFKLKKLRYFGIEIESKEEQEIIKRNLPNCKFDF